MSASSNGFSLGPGRRVYVDFDDVLCETAQELLRVLKAEFGKSVAFEDVWTFSLEKSLGLDKEKLESFMERVHKPDVLSAMKPMKGAKAVLEEWTRAGFEITVVTGRPPSTESTSRDWLERHAFPHSGVIFVDKYSRLIPGWRGTKTVPLAELSRMEFCLAIDDAPAMLNYLAEKMSPPVIVFDRPWNAQGLSKAAPGRMFRCRGWSEIRALVPSD